MMRPVRFVPPLSYSVLILHSFWLCEHPQCGCLLGQRNELGKQTNGPTLFWMTLGQSSKKYSVIRDSTLFVVLSTFHLLPISMMVVALTSSGTKMTVLGVLLILLLFIVADGKGLQVVVFHNKMTTSLDTIGSWPPRRMPTHQQVYTQTFISKYLRVTTKHLQLTQTIPRVVLTTFYLLCGRLSRQRHPRQHQWVQVLIDCCRQQSLLFARFQDEGGKASLMFFFLCVKKSNMKEVPF